MNNIGIENVSLLLDEGKTYNEISYILKARYPNERGFSLRSVKRFCAENGLSSVVSMEQLQNDVTDVANEVGPTYGRKMVAGYLRQKYQGKKIGDVRVGKALKNANPRAHNRRRNNTERLFNPIPYRADYFGHKLHIDQNEKISMYGVTHVIAIDGHSRYVVAYSIMPVKNNLVI